MSGLWFPQTWPLPRTPEGLGISSPFSQMTSATTGWPPRRLFRYTTPRSARGRGILFENAFVSNVPVLTKPGVCPVWFVCAYLTSARQQHRDADETAHLSLGLQAVGYAPLWVRGILVVRAMRRGQGFEHWVSFRDKDLMSTRRSTSTGTGSRSPATQLTC